MKNSLELDRMTHISSMQSGVLVPLPTACCRKWANWSNAGELGLLASVRENWQADQRSYHPGWEPGLWVGSPQHSLHLWNAGACEGAEPEYPQLHDLRDTRQRRDIQEESQWEPRIEGVAEARGPDSLQCDFS